MKIFFKILYSFSVLILAIGCTIVNKPIITEMEINARVNQSELFESKIQEVRATGKAGTSSFGKGDYANGGFKMMLTKNVDSSDLANIKSAFENYISEATFKTLTISNLSAKAIIADFSGYFDNQVVASFMPFALNSVLENGVEVEGGLYIFADKNCSITGIVTDEYGDKNRFDLSLKAGWNIVYLGNDGNGNYVFSNKITKNVDFVWSCTLTEQ